MPGKDIRSVRWSVGRLGLMVILLALLAGCAGVGPGKVMVDRANYNTSLTESWKRQILLNIVKIRYVEPLFFVDIGDIVAGYTLEAGGSFTFSRSVFDMASASTFSEGELGLSGKYTDRPTITYRPMTGAPFRRGVMSPMPLVNVMLSIESGASAEFLFRLGVRSINGLRNETFSSYGHIPSQPAFRRVVDIISRLQYLNAMHVIARPAGRQAGQQLRPCMLLGSPKPTSEVNALVEELQTLLDLDPTVREYVLVNAPEPRTRREIAVQTYSLLQILATVAVRVNIPEEDVVSHCALPGVSDTSGDVSGEGLLSGIAVQSGATQPEAAFVAVKCRGHWFWVDDHDIATKQVFSFLMLAFTLIDDSSQSLPVQVTIPAQ
ncbi:MAG: hypothetical protein ACNI3A_08835 [Desulfovibrio sp.]|uniref:hypothetical protein n=1 Tax=Desulfovibrio sp. 7SRBS1 TaxID=3378064 RepID=UPI003B3E7288